MVVQLGKAHGGGGFHRFLFGDAWRQFWTTPIEVRLANLDSIGGGLTAFERGGSAQSKSLRFLTPDGRVYNFRSVDKDPAQAFTGFMRSSPIRWLAREQISAMFPLAAVPVSELERSAGLIPTERWLAVLPDDSRLGKWRDDFKGMLGVFERRYSQSESSFPELPDARELLATDSLLWRLQRDATQRVDQPGYLTARLIDILIGDWDRHDDQWNWVRFDRDGLHWWVVLARDRDWALSRFDGIFWDLLRPYVPVWAEFGPHYGSIEGLTKKSTPLDRRFLTGLDRAVWDTTIAKLQGRLDDTAIEQALATLPTQLDKRAVADVASSLKSRRDALPAFAAGYYRRLAQIVDVRGTDESEFAEVTRDGDGSVVVAMFGPDRLQVYQRRFVPGETNEIRLDLLRGADTVRIRGSDSHAITLRIITGGGADLVVDSSGGKAIRVYDDSASAMVRGNGKLFHSVRGFESPVRPNDPAALPHDWGHGLGVAPWFGRRPQIGTILGGGPVFYTYGFRKLPYQARIALRFSTTTGAGGFNADLNGDFRFERPDRRILLRAAALRADVIEYFGVGNQTGRSSTRSFNNVLQHQYVLEPVARIGIRGAARFEVGGLLRWSDTDGERPTLLTLEQPYGTGSFAEAGVRAGLVYDSRDNERVTTKGVTLELTGRAYPAVLDVANPFGSLTVLGTTYLSARHLPTAPVLALRAAGMKVFGTYPFFEAATIGGRYSVRGLTDRRFAGDAAVYGNAELRFNLGERGVRTKYWGILGLADVGRVFLEGEHSNRWHTAFGGGLWAAMPGLQHMVSATLAGSGERLRFFVHTGFHF